RDPRNGVRARRRRPRDLHGCRPHRRKRRARRLLLQPTARPDPRISGPDTQPLRPSMTNDRISQAADLLLGARKNRQPLEALPAALVPQDVAGAYAVQHRVTQALGAIGGWKTAPAKDGVAFNWAPTPASGVFADGAEIAFKKNPRAALELEIGLVLGSDLP